MFGSSLTIPLTPNIPPHARQEKRTPEGAFFMSGYFPTLPLSPNSQNMPKGARFGCWVSSHHPSRRAPKTRPWGCVFCLCRPPHPPYISSSPHKHATTTPPFTSACFRVRHLPHPPPHVEHAKGVVVMFNTFLTPTFTPNMSNTPLGACSVSLTAPFPFPSTPTLKTRRLRHVLGVVVATLHHLHPNTTNATVASRFSC